MSQNVWTNESGLESYSSKMLPWKAILSLQQYFFLLEWSPLPSWLGDAPVTFSILIPAILPSCCFRMTKAIHFRSKIYLLVGFVRYSAV